MMEMLLHVWVVWKTDRHVRTVSTVPTGFGANVVAGGGKKKIMMDGIDKEEDQRTSDRFQVC
jgi:hypothetical protein